MSLLSTSAPAARHREWAFIVALLLLAWGLRLCCLEEVPPGWRDDELINIHALSSRVLDGELPIYYLGASGHEPLYHHLHAAVHAALGFNVLSGHILSVAFGTLSVALTYTLVRCLFPDRRATAAVAALTLSTSFWSLMYSRTAIRHISLPPFVLATLYLFWRRLDGDAGTPWRWIPVGLLLGASLYTYTASRLLPVLLFVFSGYLALFHRQRLRGRWRGILVALLVMVMVVSPLAGTIVQGRSRRAIEGIGADARVTELAAPLRAVQDGEFGPLVISVVKTLGMFHASGDPEWLYNIPGRPVFNLLGGVLLWIGVGLCLYRWREPRYFFLLPWLGLGLSPAFVSTPPASLGHTIVAQPVAYILPALALFEIARGLHANRRRSMKVVAGSVSLLGLAIGVVVALFAVSNTARDVRDYFVVWPQRGMVRFLYRADQRDLADFVDAHPELTDVAVGSGLRGPWDRIALQVDTERENVVPRLFNPERALVWTPANQHPSVFLPSWPDSAEAIEAFLEPNRDVSAHVTLYTPSVALESRSLISETAFANGLTLSHAYWLGEGDPMPGQEVELLTAWRVSQRLKLPSLPIVAQPPPPKTYAGPRLAVFAHLLDVDGGVLDVDDGLWVDPLTLQPGDRFVQLHRFALPSAPSAEPYTLRLGLYDPKTNQRWDTLGAGGEPEADVVYVPFGEQP